MTNQNLLSKYGFIDPQNNNQQLHTFTLKLKKKDALLDLKKEKLGTTKAIISLYYDFSNDIMQNALSNLRVIFFDDLENAEILKAQQKISQKKKSTIGPLSS